jgi:hypothetical protein
MKRIIVFLIALSVSFFAKGQYPITQNLGAGNTLVRVPPNGGLQGSLIMRYFTDTTAANATAIDFYPFAIIGTSSDNLFWFRNAAATQWLQAGNNVTNVINIIEALTECYKILIPGYVTWSSGLIFDISPAQYTINCNIYSSAQTQLTLTASHPTLNRIDVIYADTNGVVNFITGTPAADPAKPQVDPSSQIELTSILVPAGATAPTGICQEVIYDENTESGYTGSATGVTVNFNNTTTPFHLTKAADVGSFTAGQSFKWVKSTDLSINTYTVLKFYIRLKAAFSNQAMLRLDWMNGTTAVSNTVNLASGQFGFTRTTTGSYQIITIPLASWNFTTANVNTLRVTLAGSNASGFYIDWVQLQCGINQQPTIFPNGWGVTQTPSGAAVSTQPNDIETFVGDNIDISAAGKTVTFRVTSTGSTITIINDSTVQVCNAQGACQTIVFSDVNAQNVFVVNDTTLLVCNVDNTLCDTVDIPNPVFFDRGFFDPDQASFANTFHTMNGNDMNLVGGTLNIDDVGLPLSTTSLITPALFTNNHTDLNNVKIGAVLSRTVAGVGAAGLGVALRTQIDNASSAQYIASETITKTITATAGSEESAYEVWVKKSLGLRKFLSFDGDLDVSLMGDVDFSSNGVLLTVDNAGKNIYADVKSTGSFVAGDVLGAGNATYLGVSDGSELIEFRGDRAIMTNGRFQLDKGTNVASAGDVTLPTDGNLFTYTGSVTTNTIVVTNWQAGSEVSFVMTGAPLWKHNTAGAGATLLLAGSVDFQAAAGDYIEFQYDGTNWHETARKLAAAAGAYVFSNAITESPAGTVKFGGTLNQTTTVNTAGFNTTWTGSNAVNAMFQISNSNTSSGAYALGVTAAANVGAISASNTGTGGGIHGTGTSGPGIIGVSTTGVGGTFSTNPSTNTTVTNIVTLTKTTSNAGNGAIGMGGRIEYNLETTSSGSTNFAGGLDFLWSDPTEGAETSKFKVVTINNAVEGEKLVIGGLTTLTESTATTFHSQTISSNTVAGGEIVVTVHAEDATDYQSRTLRFIWTAVNDAGTITVTISTPEEVVAASTGTLTVTITAVDGGSNVLNFRADAVSSLTQTTLRASAFVERNF